MKIAIFCHSLVSDWNHGNAHFLRGIVSEFLSRNFEVNVFEPADAWSRVNMTGDHGAQTVDDFQRAFPHLHSIVYRLETLDLQSALDGVDLILAHEWNDPRLIERLGRYRRLHPAVRLFFHDTHHRVITAPGEMSRFHLDDYDGVLAYGESLRFAYLKLGWGRQVHVWHEAADVRTFKPYASDPSEGDLVWVGNWGDDERTAELEEFLIAPVRNLGLRATVHGVRYPETALQTLASAGIACRGWLPNYRAPRVFAQYKLTVHVPRRPYVEHLRGIPTIRPFEALACGIPLVSAPWRDEEGLFRVGRDLLMARDDREMQSFIQDVLHDPALAQSMIVSGLETILARHTCRHRVDQLLAIYAAEQSKGQPAEAVLPGVRG